MKHRIPIPEKRIPIQVTIRPSTHNRTKVAAKAMGCTISYLMEEVMLQWLAELDAEPFNAAELPGSVITEIVVSEEESEGAGQ